MADLFDAAVRATVETTARIATEARAMLTATTFPDAVLARVRLERLVGGHRSKEELDATEKEWSKRKAEQDAARARREGR